MMAGDKGVGHRLREADPGTTAAPAGLPLVRRATLLFALWGMGSLGLVAALAIGLGTLLAKEQSLQDAAMATRAVATELVAPLATESFHAGQPAARAALEETLRARARDGSIHHMRLWGDAGEGRGVVLWADQPEVTGQTFPMLPEDYALFATGGTVARVSDLHRAENPLPDDPEEELVEVYTALGDASGRSVVFEAYLPTTPVAARTEALSTRLLLIMLGLLAGLALLILPLAVSMARRVDTHQRERERLLQHAIESSDLERLRIVRDLHDGVIQDLAGVGYTLSSLRRHLDDDDVAESLARATTTVQRDLASLRTLSADIYPPDLDRTGLARAVEQLADQRAMAGVPIAVDVVQPLSPSPVTARLAYRVVRECLINASRHADARSIDVRLSEEEGRLIVQVRDDGVGFDPSSVADLGLGQRLLRDSVEAAGGTLDVQSVPGSGTLVTAVLPG